MPKKPAPLPATWPPPLKIDFEPSDKPGAHHFVSRRRGARSEEVFKGKPSLPDTVVHEAGPYRVVEGFDSRATSFYPRTPIKVVTPTGVVKELRPPLNAWFSRYNVWAQTPGGPRYIETESYLNDAVVAVNRAVELLAEWGPSSDDAEDRVDAYWQAHAERGQMSRAWCLMDARAVDIEAIKKRSGPFWSVSPESYGFAEKGAIFFRRKAMYEAASHLPTGRYRAWRVGVAGSELSGRAISGSDADPETRDPSTAFPDPWIDIEVK